MTLTARERYDALAAAGEIETDPAQIELADRLTGLAGALEERALADKRSSLGWLFGRRQDASVLKGLYIHGDVGRGKTMLVDLFFASARIERKRRAHFNDFMADIHDRIHEVRARGESEPIGPVAEAVARQARLLCLDELHVDDIADAMILGRLFSRLFEKKVVLVATSNAAPRELYSGGLNRKLFLPFVDLLEKHVDVVRLAARTDYRLDKLRGADLWFSPLGPEADRGMDEAWRRLTGTERGSPEAIALKGRSLKVPEAHLGVARFPFPELCEAALGPNDYLALARSFHIVLVDAIPVLDAKHRNTARRFVTMIDVFYDHGVKLVASGEAEPDGLYRSGTLADEFRRSASRLFEMRSEDYLASARGPRHGTGAADGHCGG